MGWTFERLTKGNVFVRGEVRLFFGRNDAFFKHSHFIAIETKIDILEKIWHWIQNVESQDFWKNCLQCRQIFQNLDFCQNFICEPDVENFVAQKFRAFKMDINTRLNFFINLDFQRFEIKFNARFFSRSMQFPFQLGKKWKFYNFHFNLEKVEIFEACIISTKKQPHLTKWIIFICQFVNPICG